MGQLQEIPAVIDQGRTLEELKQNLLNGLQFYLETQRELTAKDYAGRTYTQTLLVA